MTQIQEKKQFDRLIQEALEADFSGWDFVFCRDIIGNLHQPGITGS